MCISISMYPYTIREAIPQDLVRIMQLKIKVTFEFFYPLMQAVYTEDFPKAPKNLALYDTSNSLQKNIESYDKNLNLKPNKYLIIGAFNDVTKECIGVLYAKKEKNILFLEFLCIEDSYRQQGIGRELLEYAYKKSDAHYCLATTYKHQKNTKTITAYIRLDFNIHEKIPSEYDHIFPRIIAIAHPNGNTYTRPTEGHLLFLIKKL